MKRVTFCGYPWGNYTFSNVGVIPNTGKSTPSTGSPHWSDGDPYLIYRDYTEGFPAIVWENIAPAGGTVLKGGNPVGQNPQADYSSKFWFELPQARSVAITTVQLLDGSTGGTANVLGAPVPPAVVLAGIGLGIIAILHRRKARSSRLKVEL